MKFLVDQDVYAATIRLLQNFGHDVVPVAQLGLSRAEDCELLQTAEAQGRMFVTRDRDFGGLVFVQAAGKPLHPVPGSRVVEVKVQLQCCDMYGTMQPRLPA